jgi:hypothetical protein
VRGCASPRPGTPRGIWRLGWVPTPFSIYNLMCQTDSPALSLACEIPDSLSMHRGMLEWWRDEINRLRNLDVHVLV